MSNIIIFETAKRLHDEMQSLSRIPGGKQAFNDTVGFMEKMLNICKSLDKRYEPIITFRGPVLSSLLAYKMGITGIDPVTYGFNSWLFYEKTRFIEFNLNIPIRAVNIIYDYNIRIPSCVRINAGRDASIIETVMQSGVCDSKLDLTLPKKDRLFEGDDEIKHFFDMIFMGKKEYLKYINGYDDKYVPHVYEVLEFLYEISRLPTSLEELARLDGFLHCTLKKGNYLSALESAWDCSIDGDIYGSLIAFTDDVYDALIDGGCDDMKAKIITKKVKNLSQRPNPVDQYYLEYYCGCDFLLRTSFIKHLYCRSQCLQSALLESGLMHLINHYPESVRQAYESLCKG